LSGAFVAVAKILVTTLRNRAVRIHSIRERPYRLVELLLPLGE
jgi:hypothetical protein